MDSVSKVGIWIAIVILVFIVLILRSFFIEISLSDVTLVLLDPYYQHVTKFSFYQAFLSSLFSVVFALPISHALSYRKFKGRSLLLKLFSTTLVLPVFVGIFGLLEIYGNNGLLVKLLQSFGVQLSFSVYGFNGILLAHVFFNLPYVSYLLLQELERIPSEQHKLCAYLGMSRLNKFRWIEWPRLRQQLPHVFGLVFMLCFTSFATVMALGGGPKHTTIEIAIYQAIKFDFNLKVAALLAIWQILLCGVFQCCIQRMAKPMPISIGSNNHGHILSNQDYWVRVWDGFWIIASCLLVFPPLLMVILSGFNSQTINVLTDAQFLMALLFSLKIAVFSSGIALLVGISIVITSRAWRLNRKELRADKIELIGMIILITPSLVLSSGLFLLLRKCLGCNSFIYITIVIVNALMALPYVIKVLSQPMLCVAQRYQFLCLHLGIKGWKRFKIIEWKILKKPIFYSFSISFMLSLGDISSFALFNSQELQTLPFYLFQLLSSYQMDAAAVVSLVLLFFSIIFFFLIDFLFWMNEKFFNCKCVL
ncbi:thiamine import permease protein [Candidatus Photodesmus blepharus]|uniref:Thiamine transport system permease protein ThiP n=1 Tax=Candidatus Photodesmus blepharonis TaxID=1179155 RepID=A0A084CM85_9GAMM|nr:thiamine/thiamine pyrophosphate ABC transporter permease [Candidatus Photodesmus blepharus]KEY90914.1 thiamine import permease protein [Candidatus Photodesmus blepharus]